MDEKHDATRCKQCDHLLSFHGEDGCGTWLLGVRAVPLYRCACVVSPTKSVPSFPVISSNTFPLPPMQPTPKSTPLPFNEPISINLSPASQSISAAHAGLRSRLNELAEGLRRTAAELKHLEDTLDNTLRRFAPNKTAPSTIASTAFSEDHPQMPHPERRASSDRRRRNYAMIAERRVADRRTVAA